MMTMRLSDRDRFIYLTTFRKIKLQQNYWHENIFNVKLEYFIDK